MIAKRTVLLPSWQGGVARSAGVVQRCLHQGDADLGCTTPPAAPAPLLDEEGIT
jgi:hypothetical protein